MILTNTGTAALFLSLKINNIVNQTEVLVPSMTFAATVSMQSYTIMEYHILLIVKITHLI